MEGFKVNPKMAKNLPCYKEGGSVKYKPRHSEKTEQKKDVVQDKAIAKKAVKIHDEQLHGGEKTDLSKLKKGGRMKKEGGCVGRYKSGGGVSYGAKKSKEDIKDIAAIKRTKPKLESITLKEGGCAKKYEDGGMVTDEEKARMAPGKLPQQVVDEEAMSSNTETREMVAGPLRKLKQGIMEKFKSKSKTPVAPMKKGGKACQ